MHTFCSGVLNASAFFICAKFGQQFIANTTKNCPHPTPYLMAKTQQISLSTGAPLRPPLKEFRTLFQTPHSRNGRDRRDEDMNVTSTWTVDSPWTDVAITDGQNAAIKYEVDNAESHLFRFLINSSRVGWHFWSTGVVLAEWSSQWFVPGSRQESDPPDAGFS